MERRPKVSAVRGCPIRLTLLRAKEALRHRSPEDKLEYRINRVVERLITHDKFSGSTQRLAISAPFGQLALPRQYSAIEAVKVNGAVHEMGNTWYEFLPGKCDTSGYSLDAVRDLGDGWAIMRTPRTTSPTDPIDPTIPVPDIPTGGMITVGFPGGNNTRVILIEGRDADNMPVSLSITGQATAANVFSSIDRIHKDQGTVSVTVTYTTTDSVSTVIAIMEPKEEETYYHRYILDSHTSQATVAVAAICKRRHIEFTSDTDIIPFSSLYPLERGLDAMQYEDENDVTLAAQYWGLAVDAANDSVNNSSTDTAMPVIRFLYPGRTLPKFTSHY